MKYYRSDLVLVSGTKPSRPVATASRRPWAQTDCGGPLPASLLLPPPPLPLTHCPP